MGSDGTELSVYLLHYTVLNMSELLQNNSVYILCAQSQAITSSD